MYMYVCLIFVGMLVCVAYKQNDYIDYICTIRINNIHRIDNIQCIHTIYTNDMCMRAYFYIFACIQQTSTNDYQSSNMHI